MTSTARKKIDTRTLELFDKEVDKPEHDQILVRLFQDDEQLDRLIYELHGSPVRTPFDANSTFSLYDKHGYGHQKIGLKKAIELTGVSPAWKSKSPFQVMRKSMEVLMNYSTDEHGKYSRLIGFVDIGVAYKESLYPSLICNEKNETAWSQDFTDHTALFEVKGSWPTAGNLIRQLNLYRWAEPAGFRGGRKHILVGPDDTMNELAGQHGYRLVTFNADGDVFTLTPGIPKKEPDKRGPGEF